LPAGNKEAGQGHATGTSHDGPPGRKELAMAGSEQRPTDDVEGHGVKLPEDETTGDDRGTRFPDDTQGHAHRRPIQDPGVGFPDDTEGHIYRRPSQDLEAVDEDQAGDDGEGHRRDQ
jgi:hypothetical protein